MRILTENGFREFSEISLMGSKTVFEVETTGNSFKCTDDHQIMNTKKEWVQLKDYSIGDEISGGYKIVSITQKNKEKVYDVIDVEETNSFYVEGTIAHNCSYLYIDECVSGDTLIELEDSKFITIEELYDEL